MSNNCAFLILVAVTGVHLVYGQCDCANRPDGYVCSVGCKELRRCFNREQVVLICGEYEVIDFESARCVPQEDASPPCGTGSDKNCTGRADGPYPDIETGCMTYYTCSSGQFAHRHSALMVLCSISSTKCVTGHIMSALHVVQGKNVVICPTDPDPCNCTNTTPGTVCYSDCQVLSVCDENGESNTLVCEPGTVVDLTTRTCRPRAEVLPPCGTAGLSTAMPATTALPSLCDDCPNAPSGTKCLINCNEYHECLEGVPVRVTCDADLVVDPVLLECAMISDVCPPCGTKEDCATQNQADGELVLG